MGKNHRKKKLGKSHITKSFKSSRLLYRHFKDLLGDINIDDSTDSKISQQKKKCLRFLVHLYISMSMQSLDKGKYDEQKGFIPISSRLIEREFGRNFDVHLLRKEKLVEMKRHDTARRMSREFKLDERVWKEAVRIESGAILNAWDDLCAGRKLKSQTIVNLMTGRIKRSKVKSKYTKNENGTRNTNLPSVIKDSIKSMQPCPFNPRYVGKWVKGLQDKFKREELKLKKIKKKFGDDSQEYYLAGKDYLTARGRYYNDLFSLRAIINQSPRTMKRKSDKDNPLYKYRAAYDIQMSGRLTEINGGFQSASKYFKRSFFRDMKHLKMNYDLKNSQAYILLQELKACKIKCAWLESYLEDSSAKDKYAGKVGISVDLWKECFYALIMGADAKSRYGKAIFQGIKNYYSGDEKRAVKAHNKFVKVAGELIQATEEWRDYIFSNQEGRYHYQYGGVKYWKNACGMHFKNYGITNDEDGKSVLIGRLQEEKEIRSKQDINSCKRKLAAFILQGQEACFIHHLTIICSQNGIPVYKNEHDGIITGEKIPKILVREAAKLSGLKNPELKRKPLCSHEKREEMKEYLKS